MADLSGWRCSRCGRSPDDGDELTERWLARGVLSHARPEVLRDGGRAEVLLRMNDLDSFICPGCATAAERGSMRTLPAIGDELVNRLEGARP